MVTASARPASVFRSSAFARFYAGQAFSYLGDGLRTLAIPLLVFRLTGSATALGWTWGLELLPYAFVSLIGGSLADRVDRRKLMLACDALRFSVMLFFSIAFAMGRLTIGEIYGGVVLLAVGGAIFLGAQSSSIPYLLGKDRAKGAVAALQATEQSVNLVAPPIGGTLFALMGPLPALAMNAVTYLISQAAIQSVPTYGPDRPGGLPSLRVVVADIAAGWRFLTADRTMRWITFTYGFANAVGSIGYVALIPYFKRALFANDMLVGVAFGCFSGGAALGSLLAARTHWPVGRAVVVSAVIDGLGWLPLPFAHTMLFAIAGVTVSSVSAGFSVTTIVSWRMRVIPEDLIGRVFGVVRLVVLVGIMPGSVLGGILADRIGVRETVGFSAFGFLAVALLLAISSDVRRERR